MPKPSSVEAALDRLAALRADPSAPGVRDELAKGLAHKVNFVAAKAADLAVQFKRTDLNAELIAAFERFSAYDEKSPDKGVVARTAIVKALYEAGPREAEGVFLRGVRQAERSGGFGIAGSDAAAEMRGVCGLGLVRIGSREALVELTDLLNDREASCRMAAARALAYSGQDAGALLLRLKLLMGDPDPDVVGECLTALLNLWPRKALGFVARFLSDEDESIRGAAALALGESRQPEALDSLRQALRREPEADVRRVILVAVAMLRSPPSVEHLLEYVATARGRDAAAAVEALAIYRHDAALRAKLEETLQKRADESLRRVFAKSFPA